jgi:hypothetical protein
MRNQVRLKPAPIAICCRAPHRALFSGTSRNANPAWVCGPHVEVKAKQLRAKCDALQEEFFRERQDWIVQPGHPVMSHTHGGRPTLTSFLQAPIGLWVPELMFPKEVAAPRCPTCRERSVVNTATAWWRVRGPKRVIDMDRTMWLDTKRYECLTCKGRFDGIDPGVVGQLPDAIKLLLSMFVADKFIVTGRVASYVCDHYGRGAEAISKTVTHWHKEQFLHMQALYLASHVLRGRQKPARGSSQTTLLDVVLRGQDADEENARQEADYIRKEASTGEPRPRPHSSVCESTVHTAAVHIAPFASPRCTRPQCAHE